MKAMAAVIRKEFARFFLDRRMLITTVILPGVLIYLVYTIMGLFVTNVAGGGAVYRTVVRDMPATVSALFNGETFEVSPATEEDGYYKRQIVEGGLELYVVFPAWFDESIKDFGKEDYEAPEIAVYYNSAEERSSAAYSALVALLDAFEDLNANLFDIAAGGDLGTPQSATAYILSAIVPMVLLVLLFSGCMAVAPESIAGEKERGTLATMLVTPVKRSHIAIGKIISLSCISLLSGVSSFLGLILSLPNLMKGVFDGIDLSMFGFGHYAALLGVMLTTVLLLVAAISCVSALAKSVKEANSYVGPMNIIVIVVGLLSSFTGGGSPFLYLIPVYNSAMMITDIMSLSVSPLALAFTLLSNAAFACGLAFLLTRMFNSEKIMFDK